MSDQKPSDIPVVDVAPTEIARTLQSAGVAGAGGAGFPSYVKWEDLDGVNYLLVNHHESEPNCYGDKWIGQEHAAEFSALFEALLETVFDVIVVGTKNKYRGVWTDDLETATDATTYGPDELPRQIDDESGVVTAYTADKYGYSEEEALLMATTATQVGPGLPTDVGWIVHNTESLYNVYRALAGGVPVTRKLVHVDGQTPRHRFLNVPIGTPATDLLEAAGCDEGAGVDDGTVLLQGGPGWCQPIEEPPDVFGTRKRTNAVLRLDAETVETHTDGEGRTDVRDAHDWTGEHEQTPTRLQPDQVHIPLITNRAYEGLVAPSEPLVSVGDSVTAGDTIADPSPDGISIARHATTDGTVTAVTGKSITIESE